MGHRPNGNGYTGQDWCSTVGGMLRHGARVRATCRKCGVCLKVDLAPLLVRLGPRGTLLGRHPPCKVVGCKGETLFSASPGATPFMPCVTAAAAAPGA